MPESTSNIAILQSQSLTMLVQRELEHIILSGELAVGEKLNEVAIATRLGVSRGPLRECFRALEEVGLVRIEKNRGVFVRELSVAEVHDIYEIRAAFDQMAGRKLATSIQPEQMAALRALVQQMHDAADGSDLERYHAANLRFHEALVEYAGNAKLLLMYRRLVNELSLYRRHTLAQRDRLSASTQEHEEILAAIASGDSQTASQMLYDHAMESRQRMHALAASAPSQPDQKLARHG